MRLGDSKFQNLFALLVSATNKDRDCDEWRVAGVEWRRQRSVQWAPISFQIEIHQLTHTARPKWTILSVHEIWWKRDRRKAIRNAYWTHLENGSRNDVLKWFRERQEELDE
ncbi:MAG: hypothetical protein HY243_13805 [Proteobacteria bacterium]|nr:hypothetical protein [Pseudomonadota bacterium]